MRGERFLSLFFAVAVLSQSVSSQEAVQSAASVDWTGGRFFLTLSCPIPGARSSQSDEAVAPRRRYLAEQFLQDHVKEELAVQLQKIRLDSANSLEEALRTDPTLWGALDGLVDKLRFVSSQTDADYKNLTMRWSLGLWDDLNVLLPTVDQADPLPSLIGWYPSRPFSGLVIYAMSPLPWKGTGTQARWEPSLSPRLLNSQGEDVFDRGKVDPAFLAKWGPVGFQESRFNERLFRDRIGFDPLRIVARGVWGKRPEDLILSDDDWERLLSVKENRRLLAEGRVLILWGEPKFINEPQEGPPAPRPDRDDIPLIDVRPEPAPPSPAPGK